MAAWLGSNDLCQVTGNLPDSGSKNSLWFGTMLLRTFRFAGYALFVAVCSASSFSQEISANVSPWAFSGYGTLGYNRDSSDILRFTRDSAQTTAENQNQGSWQPDSRMGLQLAYTFNPQTEVVAQVVLRERPKQSFNNSLEWAYLSYRLAPELQVRLGRVGADFFLLSDYRNVGYAQTTLRPDWNFYNNIALFSLDGADIAYSSIGSDGARWTGKLQAGEGGAAISGLDLRFHNFWSLALTRETDNWRLKASVAGANIKTKSADLDNLLTGLSGVAALGIPGVSSEADGYAHRLILDNTKALYMSIGAAFDNGTWLAQGEHSQIYAGAGSPLFVTAQYLMVGRRWGSVTPFVSWSQAHANQDMATATTDWSLFLGPTGAALQTGAMLAIDVGRNDQTTTSIGIRWDFYKQAALKVQWDFIDIHNKGYGLWRPPLTHNQSGEQVNLLSTSIDWVF